MIGNSDFHQLLSDYILASQRNNNFPQAEISIAGEKNDDSVVDPLHLTNVLMNFSPFFGVQIQKDIPILPKSIDVNGKSLSYEALDPSIAEKRDETRISMPNVMSRKKIIALLVYLNSLIYVEKTGNLPSPQESVFTVKNALSIADDFMPEHIMVMVEGGSNYDPSEVILNVQPFPETPVLFGISRIVGRSARELRFLIPIPVSFSHGVATIFERMMSVVSGELAQMERESWYSDFEFGRVIRSVLYLTFRMNLEQYPRIFKHPERCSSPSDTH
ncbi:MAG: hypothetical protein M1341_05190 [Candidatus Thermoplasmatota archaeon]|nr:hypothetical protein [Candidatus Thermoplasmatota archaeon]